MRTQMNATISSFSATPWGEWINVSINTRVRWHTCSSLL